MDFPFPLTESNLRTALADRRYYDPKHPDSAAWRDMVSRGWATLYPDNSLRGDHTDRLPRHQGEDGHIYASDGTQVARSQGGSVHVRDYTRMVNGQPVGVRAYDRDPPPAGAGNGPESGGWEGPAPNVRPKPVPLPYEGNDLPGINLFEAASGSEGDGGSEGGDGGGEGNDTPEPSDPQTPPPDEVPGGKPPSEIIESGPGWWRDADGLHIFITPPMPEEGNGSGRSAPEEQPPGGGSLPSESPPTGPTPMPRAPASPRTANTVGTARPGRSNSGQGRSGGIQPTPIAATPRRAVKVPQPRVSSAPPRLPANRTPATAHSPAAPHTNGPARSLDPTSGLAQPSANTSIALEFDGKELKAIEDGKVIKSWPAVSGRPGFQEGKYRGEKDKGPLPEGVWNVRQNNHQKIDAKNAISGLFPGKVGAWPGSVPAWGTERIWRSCPWDWCNSAVAVDLRQGWPDCSGCRDWRQAGERIIAHGGDGF